MPSRVTFDVTFLLLIPYNLVSGGGGGEAKPLEIYRGFCRTFVVIFNWTGSKQGSEDCR